MDRIGWGKKHWRSGSIGGKASILKWGSRRSRSCGASCPARSSSVKEKEEEVVVVYHRRSASERDQAVERRRVVREQCAVEALGGLGESEPMGSMILWKLKKKVRKWFPNLLKP
jgi:hypothetical protein